MAEHNLRSQPFPMARRLVLACALTAVSWIALLGLVSYYIAAAAFGLHVLPSIMWGLIALLTISTILRIALSLVVRCPNCASFPLAATAGPSVAGHTHNAVYVYAYASVVSDVLLRDRLVCPYCGQVSSAT